MPGPFLLAAYAKLARERRYVLTIERQFPGTTNVLRRERYLQTGMFPVCTRINPLGIGGRTLTPPTVNFGNPEAQQRSNSERSLTIHFPTAFCLRSPVKRVLMNA